MEKSLEKMNEFFAARVDGYDEHMLKNVEGIKNGYKRMAELVPSQTTNLLDLGCGTGLELEGIFKKLPDVKVTGIDLCEDMLNQLRRKYNTKDITLVKASYTDYEFLEDSYDTVISCETLHHLSHEEKTALYKRLYRALKKGGQYIECDYMVMEQKEEDELYAMNARIRKEHGIGPNEFYHFDTPCTIRNQIAMLKKAGFVEVEFIWREGNTTILVAKKGHA